MVLVVLTKLVHISSCVWRCWDHIFRPLHGGKYLGVVNKESEAVIGTYLLTQFVRHEAPFGHKTDNSLNRTARNRYFTCKHNNIFRGKDGSHRS